MGERSGPPKPTGALGIGPGAEMGGGPRDAVDKRGLTRNRGLGPVELLYGAVKKKKKKKVTRACVLTAVSGRFRMRPRGGARVLLAARGGTCAEYAMRMRTRTRTPRLRCNLPGLPRTPGSACVTFKS